MTLHTRRTLPSFLTRNTRPSGKVRADKKSLAPLGMPKPTKRKTELQTPAGLVAVQAILDRGGNSADAHQETGIDHETINDWIIRGVVRAPIDTEAY